MGNDAAIAAPALCDESRVNNEWNQRAHEYYRAIMGLIDLDESEDSSSASTSFAVE